MSNEINVAEKYPEILEIDNRTNNEKGESKAHELSEYQGYGDFNELYIREMMEMRKIIKESIDKSIDNGYPPDKDLIKEWRAITNELEKVVGVKKNQNDLVFIADIRGNPKNIYSR